MLENTILQRELEELETFEGEAKERFKIDNLDGATWAFRKLRAIKQKQDEISFVAEAEKERIEQWLKAEKKIFEDSKAYFEGLLTEYYREEKAKDKRFKLSTPYGSVSGKNPKTWEYKDEEKLLEFAEENNIPVIRITKTLDKNTLKKIFKDGVNPETGEILPFVKVEEKENITIKIK